MKKYSIYSKKNIYRGVCSIYFVFICIIIFSCQKSEFPVSDKILDIEGEVSIQIQKISQFIIEPTSDVTIDRISDIAVVNSNEDRIAWINEDKNQIFVTDFEGRHLYNFGQGGRGPSEFIEISSVGFMPDNTFVVYDAKLDLFKIFGNCGEYIRSETGMLDYQILPFSRRLYFNDSNLFVGITEAEKANPQKFMESRTIAVFDKNFELLIKIGSFDPALSDRSYLYTFPMIVYDNKYNEIYTSHRKIPYIQKFDVDSDKAAERFGGISPSFMTPTEEARLIDPVYLRREKNLNQSFVEESFVTDNYFLFHFANYEEEVIKFGDVFFRNSYLNVYDRENPSRYLGEVKIESIPVYVTSDNNIISIADNDPDNLKIFIHSLNIE